MSLDTTIQGWIDAAIAEERKYVDPLLAELRARIEALEAAEPQNVDPDRTIE